MIIDMHEHLKPGYDLVELKDTAQRLGIDKVCLFGISPEHNESIRRAMEKFPDLIIGFAVIRPGLDQPSVIDLYHEQGFRGLKAITPVVNYDDPSCYGLYARAENYALPILFHTGIFVRRPNERSLNISCARMRPIYLDTIARAFPDLKIVGAHLGNPWFEEAAEVARWHPNVYFDLSGSALKKKKPSYFAETLWWGGEQLYHYKGLDNKDPFEKIVFGGDVPYSLIEDTRNDYQNLMNELELSPAIQEKVMGGTAAEILGLK